ncbi:hypothetical protein HanIR_Chr10g0495981 [Helianthus annuus]|nr:hypothetical protein HanIR_Chr10g0495981 [Helianthus annuus]
MFQTFTRHIYYTHEHHIHTRLHRHIPHTPNTHTAQSTYTTHSNLHTHTHKHSNRFTFTIKKMSSGPNYMMRYRV